MRIHSLHTRLLLLFLLLILVTLGALAIFSSQLIQHGLHSYMTDEQTAEQQLIGQIQQSYHQPQDSPHLQTLISQSASRAHVRTLVVDQNQLILADSSHLLIGQTLTIPLFLTLNRANADEPPLPGTSPPVSVRIFSTNGTIIASGLPPAATAHFVDSANHALLLAVLVAALVAFLLATFLSGAILKPVHALTRAARKLEQGDMSQRVRLYRKDEIGELAHAFDTMAESLERGERQRRQLLSNIAHELRTPLATIRGYLEALQDGLLEPDSDTFSSIYEEALFLGHMITDLQDLTLAEAGQLRLQCSPIALEDVVMKATNALSPQAQSKHISIAINLPEDLPLVEADSQRVEQIMRNLLNNAIKYTPEQGNIHISAQTQRAEIEVSVQDDGLGISAEHLPLLFTHFYRADSARSRKTGGSGLGLAIVAQLVHAHGGRVSVTSQINHGSRFTFTLPLSPL